MNATLTAWILFAVVGAVAGLLVEVIVLGVRYAITRSRPFAILPDEEGGLAYIGRAKMIDGQLVVGKGDSKKNYPVKRESRLMSNQGAAYVLGRQTGINLEVPTKDDINSTLKEAEKIYFNISDPLLLARVMDKRVTQETLEGQRDQEDWKTKAIIPLAIVLGLAFISIVIVVAVMGG